MKSSTALRSDPDAFVWGLQDEIFKWCMTNFPDTTADEQFMGCVEELGEIAHAMLKKKQHIRGSAEQHWEDLQDGIADLAIYLLNFCSYLGIDFTENLRYVWENVVSKRDWQENPSDGTST